MLFYHQQGRRFLWGLFFILLANQTAEAQSSVHFRITVKDSAMGIPLPGATVACKGKPMQTADSLGMVHWYLPAGTYTFTVTVVGYPNSVRTVAVPTSSDYIFNLTKAAPEMAEVIVVSSTRNNQRIENAPIKVEVLGREEMEEENTIKPANIASILGDISGIQIQQSSAVSGNANVRIQGLEGRYTQILRDGMPLYEGFSGGFGVLSIPPLDLKQVELIKGSASTLYGGGAIGGLVNIISRKPTMAQQATVTLNASTLTETNANAFLAKRNKKWGYTFFGGYTHQRAVDVNKDGFSDLPALSALVLHPKLFWYATNKSTVSLGYTATLEDRKGGDMLVLARKADAPHQYREYNQLRRHTAELGWEQPLGNGQKLELKASASGFNRSIATNTHYFDGQQLNYFTELSLLSAKGKRNYVLGVNWMGDRFTKRPSDPVLLQNFANQVMGAFAQYTVNLQDKTVLEAGLRNDYHRQYGNFLLPRFSVFHRFNAHWGSRAGLGAGYKVPNPLAPQITDYDIALIQPIAPGVRAEKSMGYNMEANYKVTWGADNELFINHAFFLTQINRPIVATALSNGSISFANAVKPVISKGFDTYAQAKCAGWELYAGYTFTIAERKYLASNQFVPLTPKVRMAFTVVKEWDEDWRLGVEGSYNGYQHRLDYSKTPAYFFMAAMVEHHFGQHLSLVLNGENLLDYRQSRKEALFTGTVAQPSFVPLWGPIDGRVINLSVKIKY